jgi:AraC-like DNA-binding protein
LYQDHRIRIEGNHAKKVISLHPAAPALLCSGLDAGIAHRHFNVQTEAPHQQLLAWRDWVGGIIDVLPSLNQLQNPFHASIDLYAVDELAFTDCSTAQLLMERSLARISTDDFRDYAFQVFVQGGIGSFNGHCPQAGNAQATILALDLNQPVRMLRNAGRVVTFFAPRALVEAALPDADAIHGRLLEDTTPLTRVLIEHVTSLALGIADMDASDAHAAMRVSVELLVAAFGRQARLSGNAGAAVRAAMFGQVRRHIQTNLHRADMSPESLIDTLPLSRATLYRLFEHEGGLATYVRNSKLREAADELVRFPHLAVIDIAYGLGFNSASDFTRAFRRAYDMAPQDLRAHAAQRAIESATEAEAGAQGQKRSLN